MYEQKHAVVHCRAFFIQPTPFPRIPFVHCTSRVFKQSACEFLLDEHFIAFKNRISDRISQVEGFSISMFFYVSSEWRKKIVTPYCIIDVFCARSVLTLWTRG
jgi:hypothetical protein